MRLTPTAEAQYVTRLSAGEPARLEKKRGKYLRIRTSHATGWVLDGQFKLICSTAASDVSMPGDKGAVADRN
jgi:hypothetical protein